VVEGDPCARTFRLSTTATLVVESPASPRTITEAADRPAVRTGNDLFDALYALAHAEAAEASVDRIRDGSFDRGEPLACRCFETGKLWTYVWTRDTAYSVDLGLAAFDPARAQASLELKLSERRTGGDLQIVQDTGSGGSYPISTDRIAWALGAERLLHFLDGEARDVFAARALEAIGNTLEQDRAVAFDQVEGLYRGETSFLDWREQTYPPWTARDTVHVGTSRSLSTNAVHLLGLEIGAALADEQGQADRAARWRGWAAELRARIGERFAAGESYRLDSGSVPRLDLLGLSLGVLSGSLSGDKASALVRDYPRLRHGSPVSWPLDGEVPIYHNRSIWPFVTAYQLRAARAIGGADEVVSHGVLSLVRGAALHLSHMENYELVSGRPAVSDGPRSGPVVNSPRQLWSIAGYLSMVHEIIFGLETSREGIRFRPHLTREVRRRLFPGAESLVLDRFPYRGALITVVIALPPAGAAPTSGSYEVGRIELNGAPAPARLWRRDELAARNLVVIDLVEGREGRALGPDLSNVRDPAYAPPTPSIRSIDATDGDRVRLQVDLRDPRSRLDVYRDGDKVAAGLPQGTRSFVDPDHQASAGGACYALESVDPRTGHASHRSETRCWDGRRGKRRRTVRPGRDRSYAVHIEAGLYEWRVQYRNPGPFNTGVTCAVRRIEIAPEKGGAPVAAGYLMLPHTGDGEVRASSSFTTRLDRPGRYRVRLVEDSRAVNMSAFRHFERYTGGAGGASGARNSAQVLSLEVFARSGRVR
jgi:hypothetical protein